MNTNPPEETVNRSNQIRHLRELIEALDARVPRIERLGEIQIAREAALLKKVALERIAELEIHRCSFETRKEDHAS